MNADQTGAQRPAPLRRSDKLIVRDVGEEMVAFDLQTERVTALDEVASAVWRHSDGSATIDRIASLLDLDEARVEAELERLADAKLLANRAFSRRTLIGAGAVVVGTPLLSIAAAEAAWAASAGSVTWTGSQTCQKVTGNFEFSGNARLTNNTTGSPLLVVLYKMGSTSATTGGTQVTSFTITPTTAPYSFPVTVTGLSNIATPGTYYLRLRVYNSNSASGTFHETPTPNLTMTASGSSCSVS